MPKAKYAHRGKAKPKSIKARVKLSSTRKLSRFGKRREKGGAGEAVQYLTRTRAIKRLGVTLKDFRCVLAACATSPPPRVPLFAAARPCTQQAMHLEGHLPAGAPLQARRQRQDLLPHQGHRLPIP